MNWLATNLISAVLLPPLNFILLGFAGFILLRRQPTLARTLILMSLAFLAILSMPAVGNRLLGQLEPYPALNPAHLPQADAIVILGAGTYFDAPEYGGDTVDSMELERLRYGARLARKTGLPILVTGGRPTGGKAQAVMMKAVLEQDFHVPVRWEETHSNTTWENARNSYALLAPTKVRRILLVTHAWHLPRAVYSFEKAGFSVIPVGTGFTSSQKIRVMDFVPQPRGLLDSYFATHEAIGLIWYRLKG
ncbi:MAG: YdcF family protein [Pseudomonadota bacterium]